ncbi:uncharacterized protein TNCV_16761 [Trichonephila clavipes]|nr:uncharacterized protein TNCV_16761 [Trichonephila clavipes]
MERETKPAPELLLAQLVLSAILVLLVGHATYESEYPVPEFRYEVHWGRPVFLEEKARGILIREFRAAYTVLLLLAISAAYFFINLLLYATLKLMRDPLPLYKTTLLQDLLPYANSIIPFISPLALPKYCGVHSSNITPTSDGCEEINGWIPYLRAQTSSEIRGVRKDRPTPSEWRDSPFETSKRRCRVCLLLHKQHIPLF